MTITNNKASIRSREAVDIQFKVVPDNTDVLGNQAYGSCTITSLDKGVSFANAQSAIEDVRNMAVNDIGTIITNDTGISPAGQAQSDKWTISGSITSVDPVTLSIFGVPVKAVNGDSGTELAVKLLAAIQTVMVEIGIFDTASIDSGDPSTLNIKFKDNQTHTLTQDIQYGINVTQTIVSPAKPGYGAWARMGSQDITFDGQPTATTLHYFKRIG